MLERYVHLSGSERIERLSYLSKEGYEVYLIAAYFEKGYYKKRARANLHLLSIPLKYKALISPALYGFSLFFFLPFYVAKVRPDFILTDASPAPFLIWKPFLSKVLKFKLILDLRSTPVRISGARGRLGNVFFSIAVFIAKTMFDGMTIVTPMMRDEICNKFHIDPKWVGILPNGVSDEFLRFEEENSKRADLRTKLGLNDRFVILYHGSLGRPNAGLIESMEALASIKSEYPNIVFFILGQASAEYSHFLEKKINENSLQGRVLLHGPVDFCDVPEFISMSDVGIVPLPNIPFWRFQQPLKLLEYMAMKKTIIVSESPAHRHLLGNNRNGIYVADVNPREIAKAMKYAYDNRDRLKDWGEIGREIVIENYAWKRVNEDLMNYLFKVRLGSNK